MDYKLLNSQVRALVEGVPHTVANLANASAAIWQAMGDINWAGFYIMENGRLVLGPFQGKPACIEIPVGRGVCGTAVAEEKTQLVYDVHQFPGHIACDSASNSEIVVLLFKNGAVFKQRLQHEILLLSAPGIHHLYLLHAANACLPVSENLSHSEHIFALFL